MRLKIRELDLNFSKRIISPRGHMTVNKTDKTKRKHNTLGALAKEVIIFG